MRVNLFELVQDLLLPVLRKKGVIEFIRSLLIPLSKPLADFELFASDAEYKANANASVISLEHHINREFDVRAKITELDGRPIDFLVTINGSVDENRLRALIDAYKLFGKSYVFQVGESKYTAEFINHLCEDIKEVWTVEFIEHQCEQKYVVSISATAELDTTESDAYFNIQIVSDRLLNSDVELTILLYLKGNMGTNIDMQSTGTLVFSKNTNSFNARKKKENPNINIADIKNITCLVYIYQPKEDKIYIYKGI